MRAVVQRVSQARVDVGGETVGAIGPGLLVLVGVENGDSAQDARALAAKLVGLRLFGDDDGKMNRSVIDVSGEMLIVSQFTLLGNVRKGRRPSFIAAAMPEVAEPLVEIVREAVAAAGVATASGSFGAMMDVHLTNAGPVTLLLEVRDGKVL
jgi:D-tyrosyl-tRNA(Tyr) deacylase